MTETRASYADVFAASPPREASHPLVGDGLRLIGPYARAREALCAAYRRLRADGDEQGAAFERVWDSVLNRRQQMIPHIGDLPPFSDPAQLRAWFILDHWEPDAAAPPSPTASTPAPPTAANRLIADSALNDELQRTGYNGTSAPYLHPIVGTEARRDASAGAIGFDPADGSDLGNADDRDDETYDEGAEPPQPPTDTQAQLDAAQTDVARLRELVDAAQTLVEDLLKQARAGQRGATESYAKAVRLEREQAEALSRAELTYGRLQARVANERYWVSRAARIEAQLRSLYDDAGPHYGYLCRALAAVVVAREQAERRGEVAGPGGVGREYAELTTQQIGLTNQLQKYTEAQKTDTVSREVNLAVKRVVALAEEVIAPEAPQLWVRFSERLLALLRNAEGGE